MEGILSAGTRRQRSRGDAAKKPREEAGTRQLVTQAEYARHRKKLGLIGVTRAAVKKALDSHRIQLVDGKIDPVQADLDWARNTAVPANGNGNGHSAPSPPAAPEPPPRPPATVFPPEPVYFDLNLQRARNEYYKAERERLGLEREQERILDAEQTRNEIFRAVRELRDALRIIPQRNASMLATMTDTGAIDRLLQAEIDAALARLSADLRTDTR